MIAMTPPNKQLKLIRFLLIFVLTVNLVIAALAFVVDIPHSAISILRKFTLVFVAFLMIWELKVRR